MFIYVFFFIFITFYKKKSSYNYFKSLIKNQVISISSNIKDLFKIGRCARVLGLYPRYIIDLSRIYLYTL